MKIPIRSQIVAEPGKKLLAVDLSQAEAWVVAYLANEPNMKSVLGTGLIHELSARIIFEMDLPEDLNDKAAMKNGITYDMRFLGKKMNHSCNYLTSPFMITIMINKESDKAPYITVTNKQTKLYHKRWTGFFNLNVWWKEIEEQMRINRTMVTPYRRERVFFDRWGPSLFKEATAHVPQSTVADHMYGYVQPEIGIPGGLLTVKRQILDKYDDVKMVNSAHDSALFEVPTNSLMDIKEQIVKTLTRPIMIRGETFTIPVDAEIGDRYGELEKCA